MWISPYLNSLPSSGPPTAPGMGMAALRAGAGRKAAAALTLFTEISISVMAVGT